MADSCGMGTHSSWAYPAKLSNCAPLPLVCSATPSQWREPQRQEISELGPSRYPSSFGINPNPGIGLGRKKSHSSAHSCPSTGGGKVVCMRGSHSCGPLTKIYPGASVLGTGTQRWETSIPDQGPQVHRLKDSSDSASKGWKGYEQSAQKL